MSLLYAANVREELVKMANEHIDLVNGASLSPSSGALGTSRTSFLSPPGTKGYIPSIRGLAMPLTSAERLTYRMTCPCCRKATEQAIASLTTNCYLPCATPGCRHTIDLRTPYNRALIKKLADQCADLDAFLAERNQFTYTLRQREILEPPITGLSSRNSRTNAQTSMLSWRTPSAFPCT